MSNKPKYGIVLTSMFKKDLKLAKKLGYDLSLLKSVVDTLETNKMSLQDFFNLVDKEKKKPITNEFRGDKNI